MKTPYAIITGILFLLTISETLNAQQSTFTKVFYDNLGSAQAYSIIKTSDNNYMIAGEKDGGGLLVKMKPDGTILWDKRYFMNGSVRFNAVIETKDSCFVMTGYYLNLANTQNILCIKVNQQGDTSWSRTINNGVWSSGLSIQQTIDNGFILAGFTYLTSGPSTIMAVYKLNAAGILSWGSTLACGTHHNYAYSVKQTPDSGYIVTGSFENYTPPESPAVMIKLSKWGMVSWARYLSGNNNSCVTDVSVCWNGLLFSVFTGNGIILMKTDFSGNILWSKVGSNGGLFGGEKPMPKLCRTDDGGYAMINAWQLVKADSAGNFLWSQDLFFYPSDVIEAGDKGFLALGNGPILGVEMTETLNPQIGIIKTDSLGNSTSCVNQSGVVTDTITCVLVPVFVSTGTEGIQSGCPLFVSSAGLSADSGCVAFSGSVKEINQDKNNILVYPNPSNGMIRLKADLVNESDLRCIKIYEVTGKCIYSSDDPHSFDSTIDITSAPDGIYFVRVVLRDSVVTKMFTINR